MTSRRTLAATLLVAGCQDLSDIRYETEEVRVGTYFVDDLCAGDLRWMDEFVRRIEEDLDAASDEPIEVHLFDPDDPHLPEACNGAQACYVSKSERVFSHPHSLEHELVHAIALRVGRPLDVLFTEGMARAFPDHRLVFGNTLPSDNLGRASLLVDDRTTGHFVRWLWEARDPEGMRRLARGDAFADAYGFPFEQAEAAYLEQAPWSYPRRWPCSAPPLASTGDHAWDETLTFACDDDETLTILPEDDLDLHRPRTRRTLQVTNGGLFNFSGVVGSIHILACQLEPIVDAPPESATRPIAPDPGVFDEMWGGLDYPIEDGFAQITLPPGDYELTIRSNKRFPSDDTVRLIITPALQGQRP